MSGERIVSADEAQRQYRFTRQAAARCSSRATFDDGVHVCVLPASHIRRGVWHVNAVKDHCWSLESTSDGEPVHGMVKP